MTSGKARFQCRCRLQFQCQFLLTLLLSLQFSAATAAFAEDVSALKMEEASIDTQSPQDLQPLDGDAGSAVPVMGGGTPTLKGGIRKHVAAAAAASDQGQLQSDGKLQSEDASADPAVRRQTALKKLALRAKLTSDDYRALGVGVLGYDSDRTYFTNLARVTVLVRGCPAEQAGIRLGDQIVVAAEEAEDAGVTDPSIPSWVFSCGMEGQPVDVTIKRGDELLKFHLIRMNIEDVPDTRARRQYEELVRENGLSQGGMVEIPKPKSR